MTRRPPKPAGRDWLEHMKLHSDYPATGCWELRGHRTRDGYSKIGVEGVTYQAHRYAYMRVIDPALTPDVVLRHTCDTPACWNPAHLIPGTHADNVRDKVERERQQRGEGVPSAKLTTAKVLEIRARYEAGESAASLARIFGVSYKTALLVIHRETWKHI